MSAFINSDLISTQRYLQDEINRGVKHELIDSCIHAIVESSKNHKRISGNIFSEFSQHLKNSPCEPIASGVKVKEGNNFFYPDVMVVCDSKAEEEHYTENPTIIIEVVSSQTYQKDRTIKRFSYLKIPSLLEYVLVEQDFVDIEVIRKNDDWKSEHYFLGDQVTFDAINLSVSVEDIYHRVHSQDMIDYLSKQLG